jgi:hypothetical protein
MTDKEHSFICDAVQKAALNYKAWQKDYQIMPLQMSFKTFIVMNPLRVR